MLISELSIRMTKNQQQILESICIKDEKNNINKIEFNTVINILTIFNN